MATPAVQVAPALFGRSYFDFIDVTTPTAGATVSVTVDGAWNLRPVAARLTLTTDANAANRLVTIDYVDGRGNTRVRNGAGLVVTANTTGQTFEWNYRRAVSEWAANTPVFSPLLDAWLPPGFTVKFNVTNIQVGDTLTALSLYVEKYPTGIESGPANAFPLFPR